MKEEFLAMVEKCKATFMEEYKDIETKGFQLIATQMESVPEKAIPEDIQENLINAVMAAHDGVLRYTPSMPELVETSCNLAIIDIADGKAEIIARQHEAVSLQPVYCLFLHGWHASEVRRRIQRLAAQPQEPVGWDDGRHLREDVWQTSCGGCLSCRSGVRHHWCELPWHGYGKLWTHIGESPHSQRSLPHPVSRAFLQFHPRNIKEHSKEIALWH